MEPYKTFLVPFNYNKLNIFMRNNSLKIKQNIYPVMMKKHPQI